MADSEKNESADKCEESGAEDTVRAVESGSPKDSIVRSLEEEFSEAARSVEDEVAQSSFVKEVEELVNVSDSWASLKNLGSQTAAEESKLPASDENVGESSEAAKSSDETRVVASRERETDDLHENPKATHSQPFVAASAGSRASWANCCGLLDFLKPSDH